MSEKAQIIFMQARLVRLASKEWGLSLDRVVEIFRSMKVFNYIDNGYGIFHCEGDDAVLEEIDAFLRRKGLTVDAESV